MLASSKPCLQKLLVVAVIVLLTGCDYDISLEPSNGCFMSCDGSWGDPEAYAVSFEALPTPVAGSHAFTSISAGTRHTCGIVDENTWCWGERDVGTGAYQTVAAPQAVAGTSGISALSAGLSLTCGTRTDGRALCWGVNTAGEAGTGTLGPSWTPTPVNTPHALASISVASARTWGPTHACALTADGVAYCWGDNYLGQLGNGTTISSLVPAAVSGGHLFESISLGGQFTCGIARGGDAYCWGMASDGRLGDDPAKAGNCAPAGSGALLQCSTIPRPVAGGIAFTAISAGNAFACALDGDGRAYCWGVNSSGQLGQLPSPGRFTPTRIADSPRFTAIDAGNGYVCALTTERDVMCWGYNGVGQLGDGTTLPRYRPTKIASTAAFSAITVGDDHSCALTVGGAAYCWGSNEAMKLGKGS